MITASKTISHGLRNRQVFLILSAGIFLFCASALPAAQITFTAGDPAVAADVNANFTELYNAKWTLTAADLSYSAGNIGIGVANPGVKLGVVGGSAITLAGATGFGVFGATTGNHIAVDSTQIQAKSNATTAANLAINPLGGNITMGNGTITTGTGNFGIGTGTPLTRFDSTISVAKASDNGVYAGLFRTNDAANPLGMSVYLRTSPGGVIGNSYVAMQSEQFGLATYHHLLLQPNGGNVGIGTTAPGAKLDVTGAIQSTSNITTTGGDIQIDKAEGTMRIVRYLTSGKDRWVVAANSSAEGGANAGSNFIIRRYNDAGALIDEALLINRATGQVTIATGPNPANLVVNGTATTCNIGNGTGGTSCSSDRALKENIRPLPNSLHHILGIAPVYFTMKRDKSRRLRVGLIAQEVQFHFPELVSKSEETGMLSLDYAGLVAPMIGALKELKSEKDSQILTLQRDAQLLAQRATAAEQKLSVVVSQSNRDKAAADARIAALEKRLDQLEKSLSRVSLAYSQKR